MIRETRNSEHEKRWISIFVCCVSRAVHLEIVRDCTSEAAVNALMRFIGRRGTPTTIFSDNAMQFKKGSQILQAMWGDMSADLIAESLTRFFSSNGIHWKHIPEASPWVGGFYERLVALVKRALKKTLWKATITSDALETLVVQIEGVLNTRPLLSTSSDIRDFSFLCPANFIAPSCLLSVPPSADENQDDPDYEPTSKREDLLDFWRLGERKLDQFWKTWRTQYLQELRETHRVHFKPGRSSVHRDARIGELCFIKDTTPRVSWKMCKVVQLLPSPEDGEVRFVEVRLPSGKTTRRGVKDLVPLELV